MTKQGKVYLIGAGPGDPGLLSIKAMECLQTADAVVYDRLADPRILAYAKDDAEMVYVGKASANHTMRQPDINKLLVKLAAEGKTVARLKGGDPFVFGRGGEEAIELLEAGLPFEFVPGVTSAIAVAEYAGIPVTHRHIATSFAVITGHEDPTKGESTINWSGLATAVDTLVFLMGVENLTNITKNLIANGRSAILRQQSFAGAPTGTAHSDHYCRYCCCRRCRGKSETAGNFYRRQCCQTARAAAVVR